MDRPAAVAALAVACALVTGCGGESPSEQAQATVRAFTDAYAAQRFDVACEEVSSRAEGTDLGLKLVDSGDLTDERALERGCAGLIAVAHRADEAYARALASAQIEDVDVAGNGEVARVDTSAASWELEEVDGGWRLRSLVPLASPVLDQRIAEREQESTPTYFDCLAQTGDGDLCMGLEPVPEVP